MLVWVQVIVFSGSSKADDAGWRRGELKLLLIQSALQHSVLGIRSSALHMVQIWFSQSALQHSVLGVRSFGAALQFGQVVEPTLSTGGRRTR